MATTHLLPDVYSEVQSIFGDLGPAVIVSHSGLTVPASSMTLTAVSASGYVLSGGSPNRLVYVSQAAVSIPLSGSAGTYYLALTMDTHTPISGWTRRAGSHYVWQVSASQPASPAGALVFASVTVTTVITAVTPLASVTPTAAGWRTHLGLGTMATQNANAVAITGGTALLSMLHVTSPGSQWALAVENAGAGTLGGLRSSVAAGTNRWNLYIDGTAQNHLLGPLGLGILPPATGLDINYLTRLRGQMVLGSGGVLGFALATLYYDKVSVSGLAIAQTTESGSGAALNFINTALASVGTITTTATTTAYNTSSDVRLKEAIATLTGALARVQALRPVSFRWQADGSPGEGFLAHELQQHVPEAVTGLPDEVNEDGSIKPQQVDHSKLVPWLTAAVQELALQVQTLTTRISTLEEALGL